MSGVVRWAAENALVVVLLTLSIVLGGAFAVSRLPIDAVPDVTNVQVQVVTRVPALSAGEVETQITQPVERTMAGVPNLKEIRSITKLGISVVTLVFADGVDVYFARALVNERLTAVRDLIPAEVGKPSLGPISTGLGEIYMFELRPTLDGARSNEEIRTILDWQVAPRLRQVPGVIDVVPFGGSVKQYRVILDPERLRASSVSVDEVKAALQQDNAVTGGGYIERDGEAVAIRGDARFRSLEDIGETVVRIDDRGAPITVSQLGEVDTGPALRTGAMTRDGRGEIVGASVWMLKDSNSRKVVADVKLALEEIKPRLPENLIVDPYYDRAEFIDRVVGTVLHNLVEGAVLVVVCLLLTLGSIRAGLIVAGAIPFAMLVAMIGLNAIGMSGNVMSLGSIDFGIVVEGAVVVVEHALTHMGPDGSRRRRKEALVNAMSGVARPVVFSVVIVTLVFLPLVTLEDVEGKMFRPVVFSLVFMLIGALFYALVVIPAVTPIAFLKTAKPTTPISVRAMERIYRPTLDLVLRRPWLTIGTAYVGAALLLAVASTIGAEFLPRIFEGAIAVDARRPPSVSLSNAISMGAETERAAKEVPEVVTVIDRIGRPEGSIDPASFESTDLFIILKPQSEWRSGMTPDKLVAEIDAKLDARVPATNHAFSQPIEMRVNELVAGVKSDLAIKVFGYDLEAMTDVAAQLKKVIETVPGAADVKMEIATGLPSVRVSVQRNHAGRLAVAPRSVLDLVEMSRAGMTIGQVREKERVFDLVMKLGSASMDETTDLARLPVTTKQGGVVPLSAVADVKRENTVVQISRERMKRRLVVECNIRGRDLVGFVTEAQHRVDAEVKPTAGLEVVWGGQFQNFNRAKTRLTILVPVALVIIAVLLVMTFRSVRYMAVTLLNLPFAVAGGAFALWARGLPFSIPAGVGFIALSGVAVMTGVVMTTNLMAIPKSVNAVERVRRAAMQSLRPVASTALVAAIGFVPMAIATGPGAEVQRPLATVVIFGLVAAAMFSLPALPALLWVVARKEGEDVAAEASSTERPEPPPSA